MATYTYPYIYKGTCGGCKWELCLAEGGFGGLLELYPSDGVKGCLKRPFPWEKERKYYKNGYVSIYVRPGVYDENGNELVVRSGNGVYMKLEKDQLQNIIRRHTEHRQNPFIGACEDLSNCYVEGADFSGLDLSYLTMEACYLDECNLAGANFSNAKMNRVEFSHCNLDGAILDYAQMSATAARDCTFRNASLTGCKARYSCFYRTDLTGTRLDRADVADSRFEAVFDQTKMVETDINGCDFEKSSFKNVDMSNVKDLSEADFTRTAMNSVKMSGLYMENLNFTGATLSDVDLGNTLIRKGNFQSTKMRNINLSNAEIDETSFLYAEMEGVFFREAKRIHALNFQRARFKNPS